MYQTSTNITSKYYQETHYNYVKNSGFWVSDCSPLLCYRFVTTALTAQIPTETLSQTHRVCFIGKERDSETGLSYFGARYYDSDLMTGWLSVDPMADKYPGVSPYTYCAWNPVKLVDPDGKMIVPNDDGWIVNHDEKTVTKIADNGGNYVQIEYNNNGETVNTLFSSIDNFIYQYENMGYTVNRGEKQSESSIGIDIGNETSLSGNAPIGMGITSDLIGEVGNAMYNEKNGTWIGKDGKVRSMSWGGNQYTGGI